MAPVEAEQIDDATPIVSELVANATRDGRSACHVAHAVAEDAAGRRAWSLAASVKVIAQVPFAARPSPNG
jgi:hypothetical protein